MVESCGVEGAGELDALLVSSVPVVPGNRDPIEAEMCGHQPCQDAVFGKDVKTLATLALAHRLNGGTVSLEMASLVAVVTESVKLLADCDSVVDRTTVPTWPQLEEPRGDIGQNMLTPMNSHERAHWGTVSVSKTAVLAPVEEEEERKL